ncbi:hypothetical protein LCGC14_1198080 [marine sediment metagenome]|uniref:Uncharacterized protein n=1 Tax=marine sediment metagenome TaxID=412755 RepID=A0A0F9PMK9_9ZZZZ
MICPIRPEYSVNTGDSGYVVTSNDCIQAECAWWVGTGENGQCAVKNIACVLGDNLYIIANSQS